MKIWISRHKISTPLYSLYYTYIFLEENGLDNPGINQNLLSKWLAKENYMPKKRNIELCLRKVIKFIEGDFMNSVGQEIESRNDIPDQRVF